MKARNGCCPKAFRRPRAITLITLIVSPEKSSVLPRNRDARIDHEDSQPGPEFGPATV